MRSLVAALGISLLLLAGRGEAAEEGGAIETSDARFQQDVIQASSDHLVVVVFDAAWCLPCRGVEGALLRSAQRRGFAVATMDVDRNTVVPERLKIAATLPVVIAYRGGEAVGSHIGPWGQDRNTLENFLVQVGG